MRISQVELDAAWPAGGGFLGTVTIDADRSNLMPGYWSLALLLYDTATDIVPETPCTWDGITLYRYTDTRPGGCTAYDASVSWEGPGSCTLGMGPAERWK